MKLFTIALPPITTYVGATIVQASGITLSAELLITMLTNVAIISVAWASLKTRVDNLAEQVRKIDNVSAKSITEKDIDHLEELIDQRFTSIERRIEGVAERGHKAANDIQRFVGKYSEKFESEE